MKTAAQIRSDFFSFFEQHQHRIVPSAPIIPQNDPTLLFTNAGMNQFKDVFLGTGSRPYRRAADTQKCLRVSGKHNDLEEVGRDSYHHTFFEMLGNWSFGDYFKKEAIQWAWQLLTDVWGIPKDRLWATVFAGDQRDGLPADEDAVQLWQSETQIPVERILRFDKKDNFWEMGETGPCGPCSEIHIDLGPERCQCQDQSQCGVNRGCPRFIEIWNLVFIQFNRQNDGTLVPLPARHVDTGMGFERLVALIQGKESNYDIDLFTPIIGEIATITGQSYTAGDQMSDIAFRVVADHIRALCCCFADGALPGNGGRGYVLRRLLRRAARFGHQHLGMEQPFIHRLVPVVAEIYRDIFPEISQRQDHVQLLVKSEEESFAQMLVRGIHLFNGLVDEVKQQQSLVIPGEKAYQLYHQDGFPRDLVDLMAREHGISVDDLGWDKAEHEHKERSRGGQEVRTISVAELEGLPATQFIGYGKFEGSANLLKLIDQTRLVLDHTPFYAESGGQVGDTGIISGKSFKFAVKDTQKFGDIYVHFGEIIEYDPTRLPRRVTAYVDRARRRRIMANHTATHLLHSVLRKVLGEHVTQQGSVVSFDRLRFDISHPQKISLEELAQVEQMVNTLIYENIKVRKSVENLDVAKEKGAMALFSEKYGDRVRVVQVGRHSIELCGGTHVYFTGDLGCFRITGESSVQTGVRRIEAVTRDGAIQHIQNSGRLLEQIKQQLKITDENSLLTRIASLQDEVKTLSKHGSQQTQKDSKEYARQLVAAAPVDEHGIKIIAIQVDSMPPAQLRILGDLIRKSPDQLAGMLVSLFQDKVFMVTFVSDRLISESKIHAGDLMKNCAPVVGGGGDSRRAEFAQGQGPNSSEIATMLDKVSAFMKSIIEQPVS